MSPAFADEFSLPPASEFGEISIETLGHRNVAPNKPASPDVSVSVDPRGVDPLKDYPLSQQELSLVFDAAASPTSFSPRPTAPDAFSKTAEKFDVRSIPDLARQSNAAQNPSNGWSVDLDNERGSGVWVGIGPYEEEVMVTWFVGF